MSYPFANFYPITNLKNIGGTIYLTDAIDILIMAFLIYTVLFLFKQTRSFLVLSGIGIILPVYIFAKALGLALTSLVLQYFFGIFLIVIVVIFQEELRRFFEYLAALGTRRIIFKTSSVASLIVNEIVSAVFYLSGHKRGALIVIPGQENIERYLKEGKMVDGVVSEEIILSIFDSNSPGHDGAVVINNERIARFAVRLPLSDNTKELGRRGMRHSAALGLSEKSDALVLAISEETGAISLAYKGKFQLIKDAEWLEARLIGFLKEKYPEKVYNVFEDIIRKNSFEKIIALVTALLLWFFVIFLARN